MLDPQAQALMNLMIEKGIPPVYTQTPVEARAAYRARRSFTQPDAPEVGRVQDLQFSHAGVSIAVRVYHPTEAGQALPALVYLHGGGWTIGDLDTHDVLCRSLCQQAGGRGGVGGLPHGARAQVSSRLRRRGGRLAVGSVAIGSFGH